MSPTGQPQRPDPNPEEIAEAVLRERDQRQVLERIAAVERRVATTQVLLAELVLRSLGDDRRASLMRAAADPVLRDALGLRIHTPAAPAQAPCATVMPRCASACCRILDIPLALDELERHPWDARRPFHMARRPDGACIRLRADGSCDDYAGRPQFCRGYSCEKDRRVWEFIDRNAPC